jgi:hypothetical protein
MTKKMSEASDKAPVDEGVGSPKKGEKFRCVKCGMAIEVTADCGCDQPDAHRSGRSSQPGHRLLNISAQ